MNKSFTIKATYANPGSHHTSDCWEQLCADHEEEFPKIKECHPGIFNVEMTESPPYSPTHDKYYREKAKQRGLTVEKYADGNYISPVAKVFEINDKPIDAWLYRGGHSTEPILEIVSCKKLVNYLNVRPGDDVCLYPFS